jgi:CheY-like chemotaxis protein
MGISQEELAGRADLHRTYIAGIERGGRNVTLKSIEKLARALEVSTAELLSPNGKVDRVAGSGGAAGDSRLNEILLVEDDVDDIELTLSAFAQAGIANPVHVVRDGGAALDYLFRTGKYARRPEGQQPPVILLDLTIPKVNGLEVLRRIKRDPQTRRIPVIVLTGSSKSRDISDCHRLGVSAYIIKPVDFQNLAQITPQFRLQWALLEAAPEDR